MKKILLSIFFIFLAIQFIPYGKDHTNPQVIAEPQWDSQKTKETFMKACGDCHSHETKWPTYSKVAPLSWTIYEHVQEGREHFNVSMWGKQKKNEGDEAVKEVREGKMPLNSYLWLHPEAKLSDTEKKVFIEGLRATFGEKKEHDH